MTRFSAFSDKELDAMEQSLRINGLLLLVEEIRKERRYRAEKNTECTFKIPPHIAMSSEADNVFDKDLFLSICEKYDVELSQTADSPMLKEDGERMTDKEKQINLQVIDIRANLHNIMKDIESKELYNKLADIDNQIYKIREIVMQSEVE
jgi:hypothetical protein